MDHTCSPGHLDSIWSHGHTVEPGYCQQVLSSHTWSCKESNYDKVTPDHIGCLISTAKGGLLLQGDQYFCGWASVWPNSLSIGDHFKVQNETLTLK